MRSIIQFVEVTKKSVLLICAAQKRMFPFERVGLMQSTSFERQAGFDRAKNRKNYRFATWYAGSSSGYMTFLVQPGCSV